MSGRLLWIALAAALCPCGALPAAAEPDTADTATTAAARLDLVPSTATLTTSRTVLLNGAEPTTGAMVPTGAFPLIDATPTPTTDPLDLAGPGGVRPGALVATGTLRLLRTLEAYHKDVRTIYAEFHQVRVDEVFEETIESDGKLWFDKPAHFRADYYDPQLMINLILPDAIYVYVPEINQVDVWEFESVDEREQQLHQLLIGFGFRPDDLVRQYRIVSSEDDSTLRERLAAEGLDPDNQALFHIDPRPEYAETCPFRNLRIWIDKARLQPRKIRYDVEGGNTMTLELRTIELDETIDRELFSPLELFPSDVEYVDRRAQMR